MIVTNVETEIETEKDKYAMKQIKYGCMWAVGGVILTVITDGQYIFYGAVVYGLYLIFKNLF